MKRYLAALALVAPLISVYGSQVDQMFDQSAKQSYQEVVGSSPKGASLAPASPATPSQLSAPVKNTEVINKPHQLIGAPKESQALEDKVTGLARSQIIFQQQTIESIRNLSVQNRQLASEIQTLYQHVSVLEKQVSTPIASSQLDANLWSFVGIKHLVVDEWGISQYALLSALLLLVVFLSYRVCFKHKKVVDNVSGGQQQSVKDAAELEDEGDYDYLQSAEGLGAQLDLARAYIAMKDYSAAENALTLVKRSGDQAQQSAAQSLWEQMEAARREG